MRDRGSASILAVALVAVVSFGALAAMGAIAAVVGAEEAQAAADAAALAAVSPVVADGCVAASQVAAAHGVLLTGCRRAGGRADVIVVAPVGLPVLGPVVVERRASAERDDRPARMPVMDETPMDPDR